MKILIVDDEPLARAHLRLLLEENTDLASLPLQLDEGENGFVALEKAEVSKPDLIFLDVQMPGMTGLQTATAFLALETPPLICFVTGYSEYAVEAFERNAIDYLLKPTDAQRLAQTLKRVQERLKDGQVRHKIAAEIQKLDEETASPTPLKRLPVREDYAIRLVNIEDILCAVAREKRIVIRTMDTESRTYYTLTQLESLLPAEQFCRTHDSCIVNLDQVERLHFLGNHTYSVELKNGWKLPVGRTRYPLLQRKLGLSSLTLP